MNANSYETYSSVFPDGLTPDPAKCLAVLDDADVQEARENFHVFLNVSFPTLEKKSEAKLEDAWYYPVICEHATAVVAGQLTRLVVVQPYNTLKSKIWSVALPAWDWLKNPHRQYIVNSNEKTLVTDLAIQSRDLIQSAWYQRSFAPTWRLRLRQNAVQYFANSEGGARRGVSTGSTISGKKGDIIVSDDLHDSVSVTSPVVRKYDKLWFNQGLSDRLKHEKYGAIVIVGHAVDVDDIRAEKTKEGWPVLHLPEQWSERFRKTYPVSTNDPNTRRTITTDIRQEGEFLRPHRVDEVEKQRIIRERGIGFWETKNQGNPTSREGSLFPRDKVRIIPTVPVGTTGVLFWDTAATTNQTSSSTAGVVIGRSPEGRFVIAHAEWFKSRPNERNERMMNLAFAARRIPGFYLQKIVIEHPGGSGGVEVAEIWIKQYAGWNIEIKSMSGEGNKMLRAQPLSAQWEGGNIDVVDGPWVKSYLEIMELSHVSTERDLMDGTSGGFNKVVANPPTETPLTGDRNTDDDYGEGTFQRRGIGVNTRW